MTTDQSTKQFQPNPIFTDEFGKYDWSGKRNVSQEQISNKITTHYPVGRTSRLEDTAYEFFMHEVAPLVVAERARQIDKWGSQNHNPAVWTSILAEEFGEAAQEANRVHFGTVPPDEYVKELIETIAVAVAMIQNVRQGWA